MHKRTTPKIFGRAKELYRNMSPAEANLWQHLRAHRMGDVHFRYPHAFGNYIVDFSPEGDDVCPTKEADHRAGWTPFGRSIWNSRNMMKNAQSIWKRAAIECCDSGIMMS